MVGKLDPAFRECSHCGEVFFRSDGAQGCKGWTCDVCRGKGVK